MPDDEPNKNQMIFIINVCNQSRPVVGYVEHQTDANQIYVAPRLFNVWEFLPIGRLGYFVPRLQRCLPLGVLTDGILNSLLSKNPHGHIFTDCKVLVKTSLQVVKCSAHAGVTLVIHGIYDSVDSALPSGKATPLVRLIFPPCWPSR
jgi:hypothetical protein